MDVQWICQGLRKGLQKSLGVALACTAWQAGAAPLPTPDPGRPLWLRTPTVSPDGSRIAFTHGGADLGDAGDRRRGETPDV